MTQCFTPDTSCEGRATGSVLSTAEPARPPVTTRGLTAATAAPAANRATRRAIKRGYTEAEAAFYIGMSRSYLRQDRMHGPRESRTPGPLYIRIGKTIRYLRDDLDTWLESHRHDDAA